MVIEVKETRAKIDTLTGDVKAHLNQAMISALDKKIDQNHNVIRADIESLRHRADIANLGHSLAAVIVGRPRLIRRPNSTRRAHGKRAQRLKRKERAAPKSAQEPQLNAHSAPVRPWRPPEFALTPALVACSAGREDHAWRSNSFRQFSGFVWVGVAEARGARAVLP